MLVVWVAVAGAFGALARWGIGVWLGQRLGITFPWGTLAANLVGCFLIGVVLEATERAGLLPGTTRLIIGVGFIGAFTTFSTFEFETLQLFRRGAVLLGGINFAANVLLGYFLLWLGGELVARMIRA
ncbi:MAG: fluoride efflux transporter CrcB [Terriglobales bacterium]